MNDISYALEAHKAVKKDLKKIYPKAAKEIVNNVIPHVLEDPSIGIPLVGVLKGYSKFEFHYQGVSYRIVYQIDREMKIVFIIAVGSREKIYERLMRRIS